MESKNTFNERLKEWMKENNINQSDICERANITSGYMSGVFTGKRPPSKKLLKILQEMSNRSENWWLFGKESYDNLDSLNELINTYIKLGLIDSNGNMEESIRETINKMIDLEIKEKLNKKKAQEN